MTEESLDFEVDYYDELEYIINALDQQSDKLDEIYSSEVQQATVVESYIPRLYDVEVLLLGSFIALALFRFLISFLGRVFNSDDSKIF